MGFDLSDIELDLSAAEQGVEVEVGDGAFITVGRWGSHRFKQAVQKYAGNKLSTIQNRMRTSRKMRGKQDEEAARIMAQIMAESILLDWRGIKEGGRELQYSFNEAVRILLDERYDNFRELVELASKDEERFYKVKMEEDAGNLPTGSDTNSE